MLYPIAITQVDWKMFLTASKLIFGREPARPLDSAKVKVGDLKSYLIALGTFLDITDSIENFVRVQNHLLKHISLTVLTDLDEALRICIIDNLHISLGSKGQSVVTGNLCQWRHLCINVNQANSTEAMIEFSNQIGAIVENLGLGEIWWDFKKKSQSNGTYLLEHK